MRFSAKNNVSAGRAGEYLTLLYLELLGCRPSIARQDGFDIIAIYNNKPIRVETKAASLPRNGRVHFQFSLQRGAKYNKITSTDCDVVALAAIPLFHVKFISINLVHKRRVHIRREEFFMEDIEKRTWEEAMEDYGE